MDFSQNNLFGYIEDLQELTIIERPVRRSLKVLYALYESIGFFKKNQNR